MSSWNRARKDEASRPSTRIEDLSAVGYELPEEHLRMVTGGMRVYPTVHGTMCGGACYNDVEQDCSI